MLVLSRHKNETLVVDLREFGLGVVSIVVVEIRHDKVRLGVDADPRIPVHRQEVFDAIERNKPAAAKPAITP